MVVALSDMRRTHGEPICFSRVLNGRHRTATRTLPPPPPVMGREGAKE